MYPRTADRTGALDPHLSDPNRPSEPVASIRFHSHQIACKPTRLFASGCQIGQLQSIYIVERSLARDAEIIAGHGGSSPVFQTRTRGYPRFLDGTHGVFDSAPPGRTCQPEVKHIRQKLLPPAAPAFFMSSEQFCTDTHCQWVLNEDKWRSLTPSHEMSGE
jgi:hypothetical protein